MAIEDILEMLVEAADDLDEQGYKHQAKVIDAIVQTLVKDYCGCGKRECKKEDGDKKATKIPRKVEEDKKQISDDAKDVRQKIVDDDSVKDLYDAKHELTKLKNSDDYDLTDSEWGAVYEQILEDKFRREYEDKDADELEKELNDLTEDKKRKGGLEKEEEADYNMIDRIYKDKVHEDVRPSDRS